MTALLITFAGSYLLGSIPTGIWVGRLLRGLDIRTLGSGNTGATNCFRILGWRLGLLVALVDFGKGYAAVLLFAGTLSFPGIPLPGTVPAREVLFIAAVMAAVLGHRLPVFARFHGGKGFTAAAGAVTAFSPWTAPFCLLIFFLTLVLSGYVALATVAAALTLPVSLLILWGGKFTVSPGEHFVVLFIFSLSAAGLTLQGSRKELKRCLKGEAVRFERIRIFHSALNRKKSKEQ